MNKLIASLLIVAALGAAYSAPVLAMGTKVTYTDEYNRDRLEHAATGQDETNRDRLEHFPVTQDETNRDRLGMAGHDHPRDGEVTK